MVSVQAAGRAAALAALVALASASVEASRGLQIDITNVLGSTVSGLTGVLTPSPTTAASTAPPSDAATTTDSPATPNSPSTTDSPTTSGSPSTTDSTPTSDSPSAPSSDSTGILSPITGILTPTPTTDSTPTSDSPSAPSSDSTGILSPITGILTPTPTTEAPTTDAPTVTVAPITEAPTVTEAPITEAPTVTEAPITEAPTATEIPTEAPTATEVPTTEAPVTTEAPTTEAPTTTEAPVTDILTPITDLLTPIPTTATPTEEPATTDVPVVTETPATSIPAVTDTPATSVPAITDTPTTSEPAVTDTPATSDPAVTDTPATSVPAITDTPATSAPTPTDTPVVTGTPAPVESSSGSNSAGSDTPAPTTTTTSSPAPTTSSDKGSSSGSSDLTPTPTTTTKTTEPTKSPIAVETNAPATSSSGSGVSEGEEESQTENNVEQTKTDVIMFDPTATKAAASGSAPESDPFAIPDTVESTEVPVVLNIADDGASSEDDTTTYVRGKTTTDSSKSKATDDTNVIGGRNQYVNTESSEVLSSSSAAFHDFMRYASVAFAGISIALLLFFYYAAHDTNFVWTNAMWSPNTWEFLFYVGYLQQMQAVSELTVLKTPYFLWDYTDSFAWLNFLIEQSTDPTSSSRRLETIVLGGVVSYADRIGIDEEKILMHTALGFALIMGILIIVFLTIAILAKRKAEQAVDDDDNLNEFTQKVHRLRSASIRTLGMCVMVWFFSLYPLSLMASFEISMEVAAGEMADALIVSVIAIVVVCFGVLAVSGRTIMHKSKDELQQYENLATWGSLYAVYTYRSRMFFIFDAVVQIITGVLIGTMDGDPTQLVLVIGIQVLYLFAVFLLSPFSERMVMYAAYAIGLLKVLNFGLAFAFLNSNTLSATSRSNVAHAFVGINTIIIIAWFIRLLVVFSTYIRVWMMHTENEKRGSSLVKGETRVTANSELYASVDSTRAREQAELSETGTVVLPTHTRHAAL